MQNIVKLKDLRQNMETYVDRVKKGQDFVVFRRSEPIFRILPIEEERWETVIDFTKIKKGGVTIDELLKRL